MDMDIWLYDDKVLVEIYTRGVRMWMGMGMGMPGWRWMSSSQLGFGSWVAVFQSTILVVEASLIISRACGSLGCGVMIIVMSEAGWGIFGLVDACGCDWWVYIS
jgi:hypothetical protein